VARAIFSRGLKVRLDKLRHGRRFLADILWTAIPGRPGGLQPSVSLLNKLKIFLVLPSMSPTVVLIWQSPILSIRMSNPSLKYPLFVPYHK